MYLRILMVQKNMYSVRANDSSALILLEEQSRIEKRNGKVY